MTAIALRTSGTGLMSREDLAKSLNSAAMQMPAVGGENQYLKMTKKGEWVYGQEETEIEPGSLWALNPLSFQQGWVAWDTEAGGAPLQEIMVSINRPMPDKLSLPKLPMSTPDKRGNSYQLEYQEQRSAVFMCVSGEDEGVTCEYKQSSTGAMKLFGSLINSVLAKAEKGDEIVPIGVFDSKPYDHKKYGEIFNPLFNIAEWRTIDDTTPPAEAKTADAKTEAEAAGTDDADEEQKLAEEYQQTAAQDAQAAIPRRRTRR